MKTSPASKIQSNLQEIFQADVSTGMPYVKFQLSSDINALLSMKRIEESHVIAAESITPLPGMPSFMIGMMNSRDRVFCIVDLAQLLSIQNLVQAPQEYQIIVINTSTLDSEEDDKVLLGIAVSHIQGIIRISEQDIVLPSDLPENLAPVVLGCIQEDQKKSLILDPNVLLSNLSKFYSNRIF